MKISVKTLSILMVLLCFLSGNPCRADWADQDQYAIDKWTNDRLKKAKCTADETQCWDEAYKKWDQELNTEYKRLMALLTPEEQKHLVASEIQWLKYRDAELKLIDDVYNHTSGSMFASAQAASHVRILRDRVILLKHYIQLIKGL
jgi:uncharacterized protein YecT (DUF1311 family)